MLCEEGREEDREEDCKEKREEGRVNLNLSLWMGRRNYTIWVKTGVGGIR